MARPSDVRHVLAVAAGMAVLAVVAPAHTQSRPPLRVACPQADGCSGDQQPAATTIGARLRLLRKIVRTEGLDSAAFGPNGAPPSVTTRRVEALLRFERRLTDAERARLEAEGVAFVADGRGGLVRVGATYLAEVPWGAVDALPALAPLARAEATWSPAPATPTHVTSKKVGAPALRNIPQFGLDGDGVVIGDIDSGFFIFHPHLFRADGGWYDWIDADDNGSFDPGTDGVDLDSSGSIEADERLHVLDATVVDGNRRHNEDDELQPARDWLYVDTNRDHTRNFGPSEGFDESDPAYGEPLFVVDDVDRDGALEPPEKLVRLDSSKFTRIVEDDRVYERGDDLIQVRRPEADERSYHGTGVASVLVGGQPRFRSRAGLAPAADLVGYSHTAGSRQRLDDFGTKLKYVDDARDRDVDLLIHEWSSLVATAQDGSTNLEQALDTARSDGILQVTPLGNLNLSKKHVEREVEPGRTAELEIDVSRHYRTRGRRYRHRTFWSTLRWRGSHTPVFELVSPSGDTLRLRPSKNRQQIGDHTVAVRSGQSPRGTRVLFVTAWNRDDGLAPGKWRYRVSGFSERDTLVGRITDAYSSWGVGIRWVQPTENHGTLTYPSTADSAVGVAAYGGRREMTDDGPGSDVGELRHYSGRGPRIDGARAADLAAPDDPLVALGVSPRWTNAGYGTSWFRAFGGTSGAGPHVAASFALLMQAHPEWGPARLEKRLTRSADADGLTRTYGAAPNPAWGWGKVDAFEAVAGTDAPGGELPPEAKLDVRVRGDRVVFDAGGSRAFVGGGLRYRYDWEYDGEWDTDWRPASSVSAPVDRFPAHKRLRARLSVRDSLGNVNGSVHYYRITPSGGDERDGGTAAPDAGGADGGSDLSIRRVDRSDRGGCSGCSTTRRPTPLAWLLVLGLVALRNWRDDSRGGRR